MNTLSLARTIARNALVVTLGGLALKAINFAYQVYVVRQLGDSRYGQFETAVAFAGLFALIAELGVTQYALREMARAPDDKMRLRSLFWNVAALRLLLAAGAIAAIAVGAQMFGYTPNIARAATVFACTFVIAALAAPLEAVLTAHERFDHVAAVAIAAQLASAALGTLVLFNDWGIVALAAVGLLAMLPPLVLAIALVRRNGIVLGRPNPRPSTWVALIRGGLPFGLIALALTIAFSIDTVMLSRWVSAAEVGHYNVAYGFAGSLLFFFSGFAEAIVPSLTRTYAEDPEAVAGWYRRSVRVIIMLSLPLATGAMLLAEPLLTLLYGPVYAPAALVLRVLAWDAPLLMFTAFCGNMTTIIGLERAAARVYGINALANIMLNAIAIPWLGVMGAAIVTLCTDLIGAAQFHAHFGEKFHSTGLTSLVLRVAAGCGLMALAVWLFGTISPHVLLTVLAGALVYAACALLLRIPDATERGLLRSAADKTLGRMAIWRHA
jgi:O-antigen/teichoic acid export membrane protein